MHLRALEVRQPKGTPPQCLHLPLPPTDAERDSYLGPQHRWVNMLSFFGSVLNVMSVLYFVANRTWSAFLLVPLFVVGAGAFVSLVVGLRRRRVSLASHRDRVVGWRPQVVPSIDVLLPSAGESLAVLENTYVYVSGLRWAGVLNVWVLDDSGRSQVRVLAERFGFSYRSRPDRGHLKKAGNLRYGYEATDGDLIAVLDADFVPREDFLLELAPYFDDERVGIVQSPQYFDVDKRMSWVQYSAGTTQMLFYRWIQAARDASDAAICVGTCALYRRAALQAAGGFAQVEHSEDVHTGVRVTRAGHQVRYVPTVVSKGLCPGELAHFLTQQYRWCSGSMSLLFSKAFHKTRLTTMQRLCYWSGFLYYIGTALAVFIITVPAILMGTFAPDQVRLRNYVFVLLALVVRQALVPIITGGRDSLVSLTRIQTTYSFAHAVALGDALRKRTDAWVATGSAAASPTPARVLRLVRGWFAVTQLLLWSVVLWRAPVYGWWHYAPIAAFAAYNVVVFLPIVLNRAEPSRLLDPMTFRRSVRGLFA